MPQNKKIWFLVLAIVLISNIPLRAQTSESTTVISNDSAAMTTSKPGFIKKIINYFGEANKETRHDGIDFRFLGGPHYSSDTKLGLGLVAAGNYYSSPEGDTITRVSNIALYTDVTTGGFYKVGIRGNHFSPENRWRTHYNVSFYSFLRHMWGIGFNAGKNPDDYTKFTELCIKIDGSLLYKLKSNFYSGLTAQFTHFKANHVSAQERLIRWDGQRLSTFTTSLGIELLFDSRDNLTAPRKGYMAHIIQRFSPRLFGNRYAYSGTEIEASGYFKGWRDAVIAVNLHTVFNYGNVPWGMLATFGGSDNMRGYYEGRFRDKAEFDATVELRQHIWRRNGLVAWVGVGSVFPKFSHIEFKKLLPSAGIGYRWEFKKNTNVRLDYGFGRGESSFIFSLNEAF